MDETSPQLANEIKMSGSGAAGANGGDHFIGAETGAGCEGQRGRDYTGERTTDAMGAGGLSAFVCRAGAGLACSVPVDGSMVASVLGGCLKS